MNKLTALKEELTILNERISSLEKIMKSVDTHIQAQTVALEADDTKPKKTTKLPDEGLTKHVKENDRISKEIKKK